MSKLKASKLRRQASETSNYNIHDFEQLRSRSSVLFQRTDSNSYTFLTWHGVLFPCCFSQKNHGPNPKEKSQSSVSPSPILAFGTSKQNPPCAGFLARAGRGYSDRSKNAKAWLRLAAEAVAIVSRLLSCKSLRLRVRLGGSDLLHPLSDREGAFYKGKNLGTFHGTGPNYAAGACHSPTVWLVSAKRLIATCLEPP